MRNRKRKNGKTFGRLQGLNGQTVADVGGNAPEWKNGEMAEVFAFSVTTGRSDPAKNHFALEARNFFHILHFALARSFQPKRAHFSLSAVSGGRARRGGFTIVVYQHEEEFRHPAKPTTRRTRSSHSCIRRDGGGGTIIIASANASARGLRRASRKARTARWIRHSSTPKRTTLLLLGEPPPPLHSSTRL